MHLDTVVCAGIAHTPNVLCQFNTTDIPIKKYNKIMAWKHATSFLNYLVWFGKVQIKFLKHSDFFFKVKINSLKQTHLVEVDFRDQLCLSPGFLKELKKCRRNFLWKWILTIDWFWFAVTSDRTKSSGWELKRLYGIYSVPRKIWLFDTLLFLLM